MEFLVNELSIHGQFPDLAEFRRAITRVMEIREIAGRFGRRLHCHRGLLQALVTPTMTMPQAVQSLTVAERRALLQWITQHGPFWEDVRKHCPDDWLECNGDIVTDTAVGEAAWCCLHGLEHRLVSLSPSNWLISPVAVDCLSDSRGRRSAGVLNYWDPNDIKVTLQGAPEPLDSWDQLAEQVTARCTQLTFAADAFSPLDGLPFSWAGAKRLRFLLDTLNRFKACFGIDDQRTPEGHEIYRDYFTGVKGDGGRGALFSDSSDDEKIAFKKELTFVHPAETNRTLFCPWHGKVQTPPLRAHFSWPVRADEPLYVVYVGPKKTKR